MSNQTAGLATRQQFHDSVFRSLLEVSRRYQALMMKILQEQYGHPELKLAFQGVMRAVPREGIRHGDLAARLGKKKQNMSPLLAAVAKAGYVKIAADAEDKRAKRVCLTDRGSQLITEAINVTNGINEAIAEQLGREAFDTLKTCIASLNTLSGRRKLTSVDAPGAFIEHLIQLAEHSAARLYQYLYEHGFDNMRPAYGNIVLYFGEQPRQVSAIARAQDVSRQAVGRLVAELESGGYLQVLPDPDDKRGKMIRLDDKGRLFVETSVAAAEALAGEFASALGDKRFVRFQQLMAALYQQFTGIEQVLLYGEDAISNSYDSYQQACELVLTQLCELQNTYAAGQGGLLVESVSEDGQKKLKVSSVFLEALARYKQ